MGGWIVLFFIGAVVLGSVARSLRRSWDRDGGRRDGRRMPPPVPPRGEEEEEGEDEEELVVFREGNAVRPVTRAEREELALQTGSRKSPDVLSKGEIAPVDEETGDAGGGEGEEGALFGPEGFDPRKAVLYAEVLRRKY